MTYLAPFLSILLFISLIATYSTLFKLFKWNKDFVAWEKTLNVPSSFSSNNEIDHDYVPDNFQMKNTHLIPIDEMNKKVELHSLVNEKNIIIFLDKSCSLCNGNFEEFVLMIQEKNVASNRVIILFDKEQEESAQLFNRLHDSQFNVFLLDDSTYIDSIGASFLPIYTKVDSNYNLTLRTPSPILATS